MYITRRNNPANYRNFFDQVFNQNDEQNKCYKPATNIANNEEAVVLDIAAPGLEKKDFQINVKEDVLTIKYEKNQRRTIPVTHTANLAIILSVGHFHCQTALILKTLKPITRAAF